MIRFTDQAAPKPRDPGRIATGAHATVPTSKPSHTTLDAPKVDRLASARATMVEIGAPPIEPKPLVDTTKVRGGRPNLAGEVVDPLGKPTANASGKRPPLERPNQNRRGLKSR
jgi:hypothetical protein